jgi:hypothetical protein
MQTAAAVVFTGPRTTGYTNWTAFIAEADRKRRAKRTTPAFDAGWYLGREVAGVLVVAADPATRTLDLADGRTLPMAEAWRLLV